MGLLSWFYDIREGTYLILGMCIYTYLPTVLHQVVSKSDFVAKTDAFYFVY